jgi:hypothetical protein
LQKENIDMKFYQRGASLALAALLATTIQGCGKEKPPVPACIASNPEYGQGKAYADTDNAKDKANGKQVATALGYADGESDGEQAAYQAAYNSPNAYPAGYNSKDGYDKGYPIGAADNASATKGTNDGAQKGDADGRAKASNDGAADGTSVGYTNGAADGYYYGQNSFGYSDGKQDGYTTGYASGDADGYNDGYSDGYDVGVQDGYSDPACSASGRLTPPKRNRRVASTTDFTASSLPATATACQTTAYNATRNAQQSYNDGYQEGLAANADYHKGYDDHKNDPTATSNGQKDGYAAGVKQGYADGVAQGKLDLYTKYYNSAYTTAFNKYHTTDYNNAYNSAYATAYTNAYNDAFNDAYNSLYEGGYSDGESSGYSVAYNASYDGGFTDGYYAGYDDACPSTGSSVFSRTGGTSLRVSSTLNPFSYRNPNKTPKGHSAYQQKRTFGANFTPVKSYKNAKYRIASLGKKHGGRHMGDWGAARIKATRIDVRSSRYNLNVAKHVHSVATQTRLALPLNAKIRLRQFPKTTHHR